MHAEKDYLGLKVQQVCAAILFNISCDTLPPIDRWSNHVLTNQSRLKSFLQFFSLTLSMRLNDCCCVFS